MSNESHEEGENIVKFPLERRLSQIVDKNINKNEKDGKDEKDATYFGVMSLGLTAHPPGVEFHYVDDNGYEITADYLDWLKRYINKVARTIHDRQMEMLGIEDNYEVVSVRITEDGTIFTHFDDEKIVTDDQKQWLLRQLERAHLLIAHDVGNTIDKNEDDTPAS